MGVTQVDPTNSSGANHGVTVKALTDNHADKWSALSNGSYGNRELSSGYGNLGLPSG